MPTLLPQTTAAIRSRIETAALELFTSRGYAATTTRQIARAAGLSAGAIYTHYAGKEELFAAIVARYQRIFAAPENPVNAYFERCRFPDDIPELAKAIEALIEEHREFWLMWYVDVLEFGGRHFSKTFLASGASHPALQARLAELERSDRLRLEPAVAFHVVYMHLFNHLLVEILFGGRGNPGLDPEAALHAIEEVSLRGILA